MVGQNNLGGQYFLSIDEAMDSDENAVDLGPISIRHMIYSDQVWIQTEGGEGGAFPMSDIAELLQDYFDDNF